MMMMEMQDGDVGWSTVRPLHDKQSVRFIGKAKPNQLYKRFGFTRAVWAPGNGMST